MADNTEKLSIEAVLREFVADIERAGGLQADDDGDDAPAGDPGWYDLGVTYKKACAALGVVPRYKDRPMTSDEYLEAGGARCPFCHGEDIEAENPEADGLEATAEEWCNACDRSWKSTWSVTGYFVVEDEEDAESGDADPVGDGRMEHAVQIVRSMRRDACVSLLTSIGIQCHDDECVGVLRSAIVENLKDGSLSTDDVFSAAEGD